MPVEPLRRIFNSYQDARQEEFRNHPLANYIRREVPQIFAASTQQYPNLRWHASPGQSRWADSPWIAAFDPIVTNSAQRGYYPVFLFTKDLERVYLSLNQGMADLKQGL